MSLGIWFETCQLVELYPCFVNKVLQLVDRLVTSSNSEQDIVALVVQNEDVEKPAVRWVCVFVRLCAGRPGRYHPPVPINGLVLGFSPRGVKDRWPETPGSVSQNYL